MNEHEFQAFCVARLRKMGYSVEVFSSNVRGRRQHRGVADVSVRCQDWPKAMWLKLEFKRPDGRGKLSPEQEESVYRGDILIVQSWFDLTQALGIPYEEQLGMSVGPGG